jgi:hypothetical protein
LALDSCPVAESSVAVVAPRVDHAGRGDGNPMPVPRRMDPPWEGA